MNKKILSIALVGICLIGLGSLIARKIPVPATGRTTLGNLFDVINTNNPRRDSNFFIYVKGAGGISAENAGFSIEWIKKNASTPVILETDPKHMSELIANFHLFHPRMKPENYKVDAATKNSLRNASSPISKMLAKEGDRQLRQYKQILLCFKIKNENGKEYKLYLAQPWPGKIKQMGRHLIYPADNIISSWDVR